jgi:hypothetical protein
VGFREGSPSRTGYCAGTGPNAYTGLIHPPTCCLPVAPALHPSHPPKESRCCTLSLLGAGLHLDPDSGLPYFCPSPGQLHLPYSSSFFPPALGCRAVAFPVQQEAPPHCSPRGLPLRVPSGWRPRSPSQGARPATTGLLLTRGTGTRIALAQVCGPRSFTLQRGTQGLPLRGQDREWGLESEQAGGKLRPCSPWVCGFQVTCVGRALDQGTDAWLGW